MLNIKAVLNTIRYMLAFGILIFSLFTFFNFANNSIPRYVDTSYTEKISELKMELNTKSDIEDKDYLNYKIQEIKNEWYEKKSNNYEEQIVAFLLLPFVFGTIIFFIICSKLVDSIFEIFNREEEYGDGTTIRHF